MKLELQGITKQFPGVLANDRISISVDKGQVLGLLGENGAGKTTLMNILSGLYRPDSGTIRIDGTERTFRDPAQAIDAGIGMVHQHFMLVPVFDVTESVVLGNEPTKGPLGSFDRATARAQVVELSKKHGLHVDPDAKIESLPVGVRQRVEILRRSTARVKSWCSMSRRPFSLLRRLRNSLRSSEVWQRAGPR